MASATSSSKPLTTVAVTPTRSTRELAKTPLWQTLPEFLPYEDRVKLSYERANSVVQHYRLTAEDVLKHIGTLLSIHYNLCLGTIVKYLDDRPDLKPIVDRLLLFVCNGQYCLTELGHGLDVINMETRATLLPDGSFDLHTPHDRAAKFMPPTSPSGYPCIAVVHARLFVDGEDRGPKVFLTQLHNGRTVAPGVVVKVLAPRGSARPVKHCLTYFNHVWLPASALLSSLEKPKAPREAFFDNIHRVITGTISMGVSAVSGMRIATYVAAKYSLRRHVIDSSTRVARPIISFSTQYTPIMSAIAQCLVLRAFSDRCINLFINAQSPVQRHFIAAIVKTTTMKAVQAITIELGDRCGAQGLAEVNQISVLHVYARGAAIAEGDVLAISIHFTIELLRERVAVPPYLNPDSPLAKHERSLISSLQASPTHAFTHRDQSVEAMLLPRCQQLIETIGARVAFDSATSANLQKDILELFVASTIRQDAAWFALNEGLDTAAQIQMEVEAAKKLLPHIDTLLGMLEVEPYVVAPIVSDARWNSYVNSLETYGEPSFVTSINSEATDSSTVEVFTSSKL
ncbi:Acyl-coenzyme A oxidase [Leucoagaricus sp. SymC.cos]|nr:Acyl-coenzyme A oxidase [Leucoagaricus sp. SymC.cos]